MKQFIIRYWKKSLMALVIIGALICMILSFIDKQYVVGVLSGLTVIVPTVIWFSDGKENKARDEKIHVLDEKSQNALYAGECVGEVEIGEDTISDIFKKDKPV